MNSRVKFSLVPSLLALSLMLAGCAVTPQPLEQQEVNHRAKSDRQILFASQEPLTGPLTLHQAMARAIKYNLNNRIQLVEEMVASGQMDAAFYSMLPGINANAAINHRNRYSATTSESISTGRESLELSKSQEKTRTTSGAMFYWNLLDFGVGYTQLHQQGDQYLSAIERRRRAIQDVLRDVNQAYWQALSAETLQKPTEELLSEARKALDDSVKLEKKGLQPADKAMDYQQELLERIRQLLALRKQLDTAKTRLASLINLEPGSSFTLDKSEAGKHTLPPVAGNLTTLEEMAMAHRPELRERDYQKRVAALEARKALLRLLPGIEINLSQNYDSNKYMHWNNWGEASLRISYNLLNLFSAKTSLKNAETQMELEEARRLALAAAVLAQVHLSNQQYYHAREELTVAENLHSLNKRRMERSQAAQKANNSDPLEVIRNKANALLSEIQKDMANAEAQNSLGMIYHAVGKDPLPDNPEELEVASLAKLLENQWKSIFEPQTDKQQETKPTSGKQVNRYSVKLVPRPGPEGTAPLFDQVLSLGLPAFQTK
ncbi:MAG: TolC family protein, partial [Magnetococcales bacterium]|nr:TolC family protein [Magnetococcales bacterium]